jgi:hypothetical protein
VRPGDSSLIVEMYAGAGDRDQALDRLESMLAEHDTDLPGITTMPQLIELRSDPRFRAIRQQMGLAPL